MTQDELKQRAAQAAMQFVRDGAIIGVGTGSTVNFFIAELAKHVGKVRGAVSSSDASARRLLDAGIALVDLNDVEEFALYVDGADEIDPKLHMIKGGGGALTREKIVAAVARRFVCIADESKYVATLGKFPLPIEVIPMARAHVGHALASLGGKPTLREGFTTDNGNVILDVSGLDFADPVVLESELNQIVGLVTCGIFARRPADLLILGTPAGPKVIERNP
jgi:ribose 5-phosphate isomerase A